MQHHPPWWIASSLALRRAPRAELRVRDRPPPLPIDHQRRERSGGGGGGVGSGIRQPVVTYLRLSPTQQTKQIVQKGSSSAAYVCSPSHTLPLALSEILPSSLLWRISDARARYSGARARVGRDSQISEV